MKILITGAAGFIGSHLFDYLKNKGYVVRGVDNYSLGNYEHPDIEKLDLLHADKVEQYINSFKPELIFHMASWAHEGLSQFSPIKISENNYNAFINTLVPFINNGGKKIVVGSSMSVYGDQAPPFNEDYPRNPVDVYAVAKTAMEQTVEIMSRVHNFEYVVIRPHNVYGPRQNLTDPYRNVLGIFMNRIMNGKAPIIYGDGLQTRAFSYIDDVVPYLAKAGIDRSIYNEIINIGPIEEYTVLDMANLIIKEFDSNLVPIHVQDRPAEVKHAFCTNHKAQELLGYRTSVTIEEGIRNMVAWAKNEGPKEFKYLNKLEIENERTPITWKQKII